MTTTPNDDTSALVVADAQDLAQHNPVEPGRVRPYRLSEDPVVRVRSIALDAGAALEAHTAPVPILVTVSEGRVRFDAAGAQYELGPGGMVRVDADVVHAVHAHEPARIVVVIMLAAGE